MFSRPFSEEGIKYEKQPISGHKTFLHEKFAIMEIECYDERSLEMMHNFFNERKMIPNDNLIILKDVVKIVNLDTLCIFSEFKLHLYFEKFSYASNLKNEIEKRKKAKQHFSSQEINIILVGTIRGYAALESLKIGFDKIQLDEIYLEMSEDKITQIKIMTSNLYPLNRSSYKFKEDIQPSNKVEELGKQLLELISSSNLKEELPIQITLMINLMIKNSKEMYFKEVERLLGFFEEDHKIEFKNLLNIFAESLIVLDFLKLARNKWTTTEKFMKIMRDRNKNCVPTISILKILCKLSEAIKIKNEGESLFITSNYRSSELETEKKEFECNFYNYMNLKLEMKRMQVVQKEEKKFEEDVRMESDEKEEKI